MMNATISKANPIRICLVAASLDMLGGQSIQAARLLDGLAEERAIVAELLPINPRLPHGLSWLRRIKYVRTFVNEFVYLATLLWRMPRYDVAHVFAASYFSFLLAAAPAVLIAKLFGKPVLLNYHSGEAEDHLRRWPRTALPILRAADRVIVPSGYLVEVFARFGIVSEAISNTVELDRFTFRKRRRLRPVLLSNRNLEAHYGVADLLRAFARIEKQIPEARLIVAGDGSQRGALKSLGAELGLKRVEFVGSVPQAQMPALYDSADVFVNASLVDNMPLSIIEAFACGLAVVTTGAGGITHLLTHGWNGVMVMPGDHRALAQAVISLLADQEKAASMIETARTDGRRYAWEAVRTKWLDHYRELARLDDQRGVAVATAE